MYWRGSSTGRGHASVRPIKSTSKQYRHTAAYAVGLTAISSRTFSTLTPELSLHEWCFTR